MIEVNEFKISIATDIEIEILDVHAKKVYLRWRSGNKPWQKDWLKKGDTFAVDQQRFSFNREEI